MKKASDYMEASGIPDDDHTEELKHCLQGKARVWYDEIDVPTDWDNMSDKFCQCFCIYGRASEDWYHQWNKMSFNPNSDNDIEDFITEVKTLQSLLNLPNKLVVTTLNVETVVEMYDMLRAMFPKNRVTASATNPFSMHHAVGTKFSFQNGKSPKNRKGVTFDQSKLVKNAMERLTDSINRLTIFKDGNHNRSPHTPQNAHPHKPFISRNKMILRKYRLRTYQRRQSPGRS